MVCILVVESIRIRHKPCVEGIPDGITVEYFGVAADSEFIILRPTENWEYTGFVCLMRKVGIGVDPGFHSVPIQKVVRYRDGGTTDVLLKDGRRFHFPLGLAKGDDAVPNLDGAAITVYA